MLPSPRVSFFANFKEGGPKEVKKYKYMSLKSKNGDSKLEEFHAQLNALGEKGWRVVNSVLDYGYSGWPRIWAFLEKEI